MDVLALQQRAQRLLSEGRLPPVQPSGSYAGRGMGHVCALCDETMGEHDVEIELQFRIGDGRPGDEATLYFHRVCATACNIEWSRFRRSA